MIRNWDKKFWIGIFVTVFLAGTGGVSAFYKVQNNNNEKIIARIAEAEAQIKKESNEKFATKEELSFIKQMLIDLKESITIANNRLYEIQKNQILAQEILQKRNK